MSGPAFSLENTYITKTYQAIFDDETELVIQVGEAVPANTGDGLHITLDWQTEEPEWATGLTDEQILDLMGLLRKHDDDPFGAPHKYLDE